MLKKSLLAVLLVLFGVAVSNTIFARAETTQDGHSKIEVGLRELGADKKMADKWRLRAKSLLVGSTLFKYFVLYSKPKGELVQGLLSNLEHALSASPYIAAGLASTCDANKHTFKYLTMKLLIADMSFRLGVGKFYDRSILGKKPVYGSGITEICSFITGLSFLFYI